MSGLTTVARNIANITQLCKKKTHSGGCHLGERYVMTHPHVYVFKGFVNNVNRI